MLKALGQRLLTPRPRLEPVTLAAIVAREDPCDVGASVGAVRRGLLKRRVGSPRQHRRDLRNGALVRRRGLLFAVQGRDIHAEGELLVRAIRAPPVLIYETATAAQASRQLT